MKFYPLQTPIMIGCRTYLTVLDEYLLLKEGLRGCCVQGFGEIKIYTSMPDIEKTKTWLHEITHAKDFVYNSHNLSQASDDTIDQLAEADLQILPQMGIEICWDDPTVNTAR